PYTTPVRSQVQPAALHRSPLVPWAGAGERDRLDRPRRSRPLGTATLGYQPGSRFWRVTGGSDGPQYTDLPGERVADQAAFEAVRLVLHLRRVAHTGVHDAGAGPQE